ncbi:hypothetical protein SDC9_132452 [bioreactor metagenome]|uniref:Uncharacterized protein n=1 Tax=bioreactor metagenome TaxID=1076179 RepID=A0A645D9S5_9ZZZZ
MGAARIDCPAAGERAFRRSGAKRPGAQLRGCALRGIDRRRRHRAGPADAAKRHARQGLEFHGSGLDGGVRRRVGIGDHRADSDRGDQNQKRLDRHVCAAPDADCRRRLSALWRP